MSHPKPDGAELSFEFFPPKTPQGSQKLHGVWTQLAELKPQFFSVTYGAGGSTREGTLDTVRAIQGAGHQAAPHLSCVGASRSEIQAILGQFRSSGIRHIVALRGDLPSGMAAAGELAHASDLVALIRKETGAHFRVDVACYPECHPQARSARDDLLNFKRKVEAGADAAITQYFYNADSYFRFVDECAAEGIAVPILAGIMPIGNYSQLARFSEACGAEIPRWLRLRMEGRGDDLASIRAFGLDVVSALCERLLAGGAPGLHFYTLNHADLAMEIWKRVKP
jgi:methylenetetrahydrofolate reductase (NADPH)